jgi:hypothetical protein
MQVMSATTLLLLSLASRKNVAKMLLSNSAWLCFSGLRLCRLLTSPAVC